MTTTIEPWVQAGLERMERQAPNRYWKVMGAIEQERRAAQLERQLAQAEALKVEIWKKERAEWKEAKKQEKKQKERDRLYRSWKARQPERGAEETKPDFADQLFDIPNVIAGVLGVGLVFGFFSVMATTMGSAIVVWVVGFGIVCSFLQSAGEPF